MTDLRLAVRQLLRAPGFALVAVLSLALAVSGALRHQLYGVGAGDPLTFVATPLVLLGVAALATWVPARRATRVPPTEALRAE